MIRTVSVSALIALAKPTIATSLVEPGKPADTTRQETGQPAVSQKLNTPLLLNADSTRRFVPIYFCGEAVPIDRSSISRQWMRTLMQCQAQREELYVLRKRAAVFFPVIDPILRRFSIPYDFRYIPLAESALVNDCVSPKGASGYWQLMPQTARELGLIVNDEIDERYDMEKATIAVCRYLRDLYRELGSWTLVAAAYNGGLSRIQERMIQQRQNNYFSLKLYRETSQYLFRVLAYKELLSNPHSYRLLLSSDVLAYLTRPLPAHLTPLPGQKTKGAAVAVGADTDLPDANRVDPAWGPRQGDSFLDAPSLADILLAGAAYASLDPFANTTNPDLTREQKGIPVPKLLGLMVLRFRRPRFLRQVPGTGRRPRHRWEWV
ncbi:lytic transglycosylase catalytic [Fibrella aestuarina BUZ 2]|uniref:Lytic transglycosylase catalytic n=1 Tax=Fibrella aestuarina BUZ 2 TaxID=1166018 RepID=I0K7J3_9BACT|nr:lytic transglycosylase domain-containing protein [Fibrella aestuarina]CCH00096.1 lytic transglycosylase catalytic [Fibrella aestuarina BUZ 2]